ncbi:MULTISPECIES: class I adenylate-forming enzyme family protein [Paenibacillus]|uniref:Long-chain fatty acid--CoA ligase n=1 Tax=Paenibacillus naphthalenovorans TaxID=162209 RepID=A0A0U2N1W0_9BACL|nr:MULTISPECIES: AMP-binding protein [Paenibacillus]ALS24991.1 long-chain fatty acid--CoA ligase [Paenibacillus naphthalenovorans]
MLHLSYMLNRFARQASTKPALIDQHGVTWTREQLVARINRVGNALKGLGLIPGDRVGLLHEDSRQYLEVDYGVMAGGYVRVPLDPRLSKEQMVSQLRDAGARAIIVSSRHTEMAVEVKRELDHCLILSTGGKAGEVLDYEEVLSLASPSMPERLNPDALASLNYTGGTTGQPKAVMLTHANLYHIISNALLGRPVAAGDVFLNVRPLWPIAAINVLFHLLGGALIVLGGRFEAETFGRLVGMHRANATSLVPTQLVRLLDGGIAPTELASLHTIDIGAGAVQPDVFRSFLELYGPKLGVLYGLTEASWTCYLSPKEFVVNNERSDRLIRSAGREMMGYRVTIQDEDGQVLPPHTTGEIVIQGANVMQGYWNRPDLTRPVLYNGEFHTGDLGQLDDEGYLYVVGRKKEVIRSGGSSILPQEVEHVLMNHPAIREAAVVGVPDREWGECVKAFIVLRPGRRVTYQEIADHCRQRLASFMKPKIIEVVESLPKSHYGKVLKHLLVAENASVKGDILL